jgi:RNA recognition motif-containing protein
MHRITIQIYLIFLVRIKDDIYGSILSDPKSNSKSNKYSDQYSETNIQLQHPQSSSFNQGPAKEQIPIAPIPPQASLFISNLTWWTSEDDLRQFLGDLSNRIKELQFLENKPNGKSKGMVIVEFVDVATAEVAKEILEGRGIFGRLCEVSFARNPPVKPYERAVGMSDVFAQSFIN